MAEVLLPILAIAHIFGAGDALGRPPLGEQNVTLAVNICFDIGASFDPKIIEGNSGE